MPKWTIDQSHSSIHFKVRHLMISYVKGAFAWFSGTLDYDPDDVTKSSIEVEIDASSINTREPDRDTHLKSQDFLDVANFPTLHFRSTGVSAAHGKSLRLSGELTLHGVTRTVAFDVDGPSAIAKDPWGNSRTAESAIVVISRKEFGLSWNAALEAGGFVVGDEVTIDLELEFMKAKD
jgi:polyisoprenoid-binding protein YceI